MMLDYDAFRESFLDPGRWLEGEAASRDATAQRPDDPQAWLCRGVVLAHLDRKEDARRALARSVELDGRRARSRWWLGRMLEEAGEFDVAAAQFTAALAADPAYEAARYAGRFNDAARRERDAARAKLAGARDLGAAERYLLIRSWGSGFWSEILHLLGGLLTAELTGRIPVVGWGANCLFRDPDRDNAFPDFFEPVSALAAGDLPLHAGPLFPPKWHAGNLAAPEIAKRDGEWSRMPSSAFIGRPETVAVYDHFNSTHLLRAWIPVGHPWHGLSTAELNRAILNRYISPRAEFVERAEDHIASLFGGSPFDAVHLRGTDKATEMPLLDAVNAQTLSLVQSGTRPLFVQTDSQPLLARVGAVAGTRVRSIECRRGTGEVGVHFERAVSPRTLGEEVLVDALVSRCAAHFVGNAWSSVSSAVRAWSARPEGVTLLGPFDMTLDHYGEYFV